MANPNTTDANLKEVSQQLKRANKALKEQNEILRFVLRALTAGKPQKVFFPLISKLTEQGIPVGVSCRTLGVTRQLYYRWLKQPVSQREDRREKIIEALLSAHRRYPDYGYRRLTPFARTVEPDISERTVWSICRSLGIASKANRV